MSDPKHTQPAQGGPPLQSAEDSSSQALSEAMQSSFQVVKLLMIGLVALFCFSGGFIVKPNEVVVVLRFGKPKGIGPEQLLKPGWHWAMPYPIDEKVRIPIGQSHTVRSSAGWYATTPDMEARNEEPQPRGYLSPEIDGYTLTADGNIIHVRATVNYRISDPIRYTFGFTNTLGTLTNVINNAILFASSRFTADAALYSDRARFRDAVMDRVNQQVNALHLGISLEPGDVETKAPADVRQAFENVNAAMQERSKLVSDARGYSDEVTSTAVGEARAVVSGGLVSSNRVVSAIIADATYFQDQLPSYQRNPALFRERVLAATMGRALTNAQEKFFLPDRIDGQPRELRLQLSREPQKKERESAY
jgi:membrane protease subunit HflK